MQNLYIIWQKRYETGIPIIDEQYRGLMSMINSIFFFRGDVAGDVDRILSPVSKMFQSYILVNNITVEYLMRASDYPLLEKYQQIHEEMVLKVDIMTNKYRNARDVEGYLDFLKTYWMATISKNEAEYMPHLLEYYHRQQ